MSSGIQQVSGRGTVSGLSKAVRGRNETAKKSKVREPQEPRQRPAPRSGAVRTVAATGILTISQNALKTRSKSTRVAPAADWVLNRYNKAGRL